MFRLILRRVLAVPPTLLLTTFLVFVLMKIAPGSVAESILGDAATPEAVAAKETELGLDRNMFAQYLDWLDGAIVGDFGESFLSGRAVDSSIWSTLPVTLWLTAGGLTIAIAIGLSAGIAASVRPGGWVDRLVTVTASIGLAVPGFWIGMIFAFYLGVRWGWFPATGYTPIGDDPIDWFMRLVLPSVALGSASAGAIARQMRNAMIEVLQRDYIRAQRAKGASLGRILRRHAFRNAMVPVSTVVGFQAATMLGGSIAIERVFALPGLSTIVVPAVLAHDVPVVLAVVAVTATAIVLVNLLNDLLYGWFDPRVRVS